MHQFPSLKCNVLLGGQSSFQSCGQVLAKACICCCLLSLANRPMASARHNLEGLPNDMKLDCFFGSTDFSNHINLQKKVRLQSKPKQSFLFLRVFFTGCRSSYYIPMTSNCVNCVNYWCQVAAKHHSQPHPWILKLLDWTWGAGASDLLDEPQVWSPGLGRFHQPL